MTTKVTEKIIEALHQLMEGYSELQDAIENDIGVEDDDATDEDSKVPRGPAPTDADTALLTELKAALETVMETEDYTPEEFASMLSGITDALEEIDPEVFEDDLDEEEFEGEDYEDDDDDDDEEDDEEEDDEDEE